MYLQIKFIRNIYWRNLKNKTNVVWINIERITVDDYGRKCPNSEGMRR